MLQDGIRSIGNFLLNRLMSGIWVPMLVAVVVAILAATGLGLWDRAGLSAQIAAFGPLFAFGADGAENMLDALLTVQIAVLTLYISISLIVLTLAAQSLGARLIERWIARVEMRMALASWAGLVAFSLTARLFVMPEIEAPRGLMLANLALTLIALGWLGFGYHRLARTAHVDTSIAALGRAYAADRQDWGLRDGPDPAATPDTILRAWRSGYLGGFDRDALIDMGRKVGGRAAFRVPDGAFVVEGDPLVYLWGDDGRLAKALRKSCEIADYRTDRPTGPFSLALLCEVASRALSPGINDHETAAACADWIGHGLAQRLGHEDGPEGWFVDDSGEARLFVPESGVVLQSLPYLSGLHRAARPHPMVLARLIAAYSTARARATDARDAGRLGALIAELREHAPEDLSEVERTQIADAGRRGLDQQPLAAE